MEFFNKQLNKILGIKSEIDLDLNRVLPSELVINSSGTHLYSYGISLFRFYTKKRKKLYNPILIFIINSIFITRMAIVLLSSEDNSDLLIILGDYSHYYNMRIHKNRIFILWNSLEFYRCTQCSLQFLSYGLVH
jgi:hypothetical protein